MTGFLPACLEGTAAVDLELEQTLEKAGGVAQHLWHSTTELPPRGLIMSLPEA